MGPEFVLALKPGSNKPTVFEIVGGKYSEVSRQRWQELLAEASPRLPITAIVPVQANNALTVAAERGLRGLPS